jgi:DNA-binding transcriptional LysR family regulator
MNWEDLKIFAALARSYSLSATARRLKLDHSTVARRVAALEAALGVRLFDRLPRGYALTAEGARIAALALPLEEQALAIERTAGGQEQEIAGTVRISAPPVFASHFIAPRLGPLRHAHPRILVELIGEREAASLVRREADLAIRLSRPEEGAIVARKLGTMGFGLYGAPAYLAATRPGERDFIGYDEAFDHVVQQRWLRELADGRPLALCANDLAIVHHAARAGLGLAVLPRFLGDGDAALERLAGGADIVRDVWLLIHPDLRRSPRIRIVTEALVALVRAERRLLAGD